LRWGGPGKDPMDAMEFLYWRALIEIVEPHEQEQARKT
jgi:hypothetical protein